MNMREKLEREVRYELGQLAKVGEMAQQLIAIAPEDRRPWDAAAAAKYIAARGEDL